MPAAKRHPSLSSLPIRSFATGRETVLLTVSWLIPGKPAISASFM